MDKKQSWSCRACGATTTNPTHQLIEFFHASCPANNTPALDSYRDKSKVKAK